MSAVEMILSIIIGSVLAFPFVWAFIAIFERLEKIKDGKGTQAAGILFVFFVLLGIAYIILRSL